MSGKVFRATMDVTRKNFKEVLPIVRDAIDSASFLSFDLEFTGLGTKSTKTHALDTAESRYLSLRNGSVQFLPLQFGLTCFERKEETNQYIARSFNFSVFPRPFSNQAHDDRFLCQASSIDFLITHNFDFNKAFRDGISSITPSEEKRLREMLTQKHQMIDEQKSQVASPAFTSPNGDPQTKDAVVGDENKAFIDDVCEKIDKLLESSETVLALEPCNGFLRKLIYQTAASKYKNKVHLETQTGEKRQRFIEVHSITSELDLQQREAARRQKEIEEIEESLGFTKVVDLVSKSGKLLVGHNMFLDVLHTINRYRCALPDDYNEFKEMVTCIFPKLIDTKLMATTHPFREIISQTSLSEMLSILSAKPFQKPNIEIPDGFTPYTKNMYHDAGFDSYMTGQALISMLNYLSSMKTEQSDVITADSAVVQPFINKLYLMRVHDIPYANLGGPEISPCRDHVFHVTHPKTWRVNDLIQLFSVIGPIQITWLDDVSCFASLKYKESKEKVLSECVQNGVVVTSYSDFIERRSLTQQAAQNGGKRRLPAADVDLPIKRKRRSSEGSVHRPSIDPIPEEEEECDSNTQTESENKTDKIFEVGSW